VSRGTANLDVQDHVRLSLFIRADASPEIGTGHVMRCLALAQAFQVRGGRVVFAGHIDSEGLKNRIHAEGFEFVPIKSFRPDGSDLLEILGKVPRERPGFHPQGDSVGYPAPRIVLDGYHFDSQYQKNIKEAGFFLLVIDDMAHLRHYHSHIILNQNILAERQVYHCDPDTRLLRGLSYVLLRREFNPWRGRRKAIPDTATKILVTLGGSDSNNVTSDVVAGLKGLVTDGLEVKILVGAANRHFDDINRTISCHSDRFQLLQGVDRMPEMMAWADLAISAGGTTCWEMAFLGLPNLIVVLSENQVAVAEGLEQAGCSLNMGHFAGLRPMDWTLAVRELVFDRGKRERMSAAGQRLIDGLGVERVIREMLKGDLEDPEVSA
jgi:UDP-2,4-diacetamido-2,4,6-trideoxy-beta-L-altropyranose hydrolase